MIHSNISLSIYFFSQKSAILFKTRAEFKPAKMKTQHAKILWKTRMNIPK
jgi:hypothetical protein